MPYKKKQRISREQADQIMMHIRKLEQTRINLNIPSNDAFGQALSQAIQQMEETYQEFLLQTEAPKTWGDVKRIAEQAGFGDDEYLTLTHHKPAHMTTNDQSCDDWPLWEEEKTQNGFAVYWTHGENEGYYICAQPLFANADFRFGRTREPLLLGKFWDLDRAERCVWFLQRLLGETFFQ